VASDAAAAAAAAEAAKEANYVLQRATGIVPLLTSLINEPAGSILVPDIQLQPTAPDTNGDLKSQLDAIPTPGSSSTAQTPAPPAQVFTPQVPIPNVVTEPKPKPPLNRIQPTPPPPPVYTEPVPVPAPLPNLPPPPPVTQEPLMPVVAPKKVVEGPSPIHTYTSDFSDRIDQKSASTFSVLAAQSDAGALTTQKEPAPPSHKNALIIAFSVLLFVVAGGGAYAAYWYVSQRSFVPVVATIPSLVFADDRQVVSGEGSQLIQAIADSAASGLASGKVRVLYLTEASTTPDKKPVTVALPGGRLVGALQLAAPDILLRNIGSESTVGVVAAGSETRAFFILRVLSYERTFAGMLGWEAAMADQLALLYPVYPVPPPPPPTIVTTTKIVKGKRVTATSTVDVAPPPYQAPHFIDEVASNHDVRALKDSSGRTILLYGYRDKQTLIIARDEAAFAELSNRLAATKQQ
jgi:hypothetical protein